MQNHSCGRRSWQAAFPALAALLAVVTGCAVMRMQQVPSSIWLQNAAALLVGGLGTTLYLSAPGRMGDGDVRVVAALCVAVLCCTFAGPGMEGVHRWIRLGPVSLNAAFLCVPVVLAIVERAILKGRLRLACALSAVTGVILFLQPDASMVSAFALAALPVLCRGREGCALRVGVCAALLLLAAVCWCRPDGLEPVAYVEGILLLAWESGPVWGIVSVLSLLVLFWPFAMGLRRPASRALCSGFALYYAALLASSFIGVFPVPVIGYGVSPVIGYLISVACAVSRWQQSAQKGEEHDG